jgi:DNA polymerase-3 subunit delta
LVSMQISTTQLAAHLNKGLKSLYTLHGDEPLLIQEALDAIRAAARAQGFSERTSHTVSGAHFDWSEVLAACGSLSLFADKQIVELRIPSGKPGKEGSLALQQLVDQSRGNDATLTLVILPRLDKMTKATAWFAALEGGVTLEVSPVERNALAPWIAQRLAAQGQRVAPGEEGQRTLQFFADRVEGNLLAAHQEIQKLALLHPPGELSFEQIESAVLNVARYDVFKLSEAVLAGQMVRVQRMLEGLQAEGEAEVLVHYTLADSCASSQRVRRAPQPLSAAIRAQR